MVEKNVTRALAAKRVNENTRREDSAVAESLLTPAATLKAASQTTGEKDCAVEENIGSPEEEGDQGDEADRILDVDSIISVPRLSKETVKDVLKATNMPPPAIEVSSDLEEERAHLWAKVKEAQSAGDKILCKYLSNMLAAMDEPVGPVSKPPVLRTVSATPVLLNGETGCRS
ncbi:hypothetical protein PtA15_17A67 [Puccinia triticina]|uniref:Uncharacterized protein n=1 Tax=Puccinia triticina TaxID=208348 RepID=A0ABY7D4P5_9BASI|nr:uncharacterized protein PtA15_17A67 [Puccinia triticina]WAQ92586.1 hypothetical protein PtA15_17A67 [Puccinia triticina]